jgi:hypothetical protein
MPTRSPRRALALGALVLLGGFGRDATGSVPGVAAESTARGPRGVENAVHRWDGTL